MNYQIVFKLRDEIRLNRIETPFLSKWKLTDEYMVSARQFIAQTRSERCIIFNPDLADFNAKIEDTAIVDSINYLFDYNEIDAFEILLNGLEQNHAPYQLDSHLMPNFYNFFVIDFKVEVALGEIEQFLATLGQFLPQNPNDNVFLLEHLYLKQQATAASPAASTDPKYFQDSGTTPPEVENGIDVKIGIVEQNGWNLITPEGLKIPSSNVYLVRVTGRTGVSRNDLLQMDYYNREEHGTMVLGVLKASPPACQGMVPEATFRLSSCIMSPASSGGGYKYSSENALLALLLELYSHKGSIILLEIQGGLNGYPIEMEPAMYELIRLATTVFGITVIEPAGNAGARRTGLIVERISRATMDNFINDLDPSRPLSMYSRWEGYEAICAQIAANTSFRTHALPCLPLDGVIRRFFNKNSEAIVVGAASISSTTIRTRTITKHASSNNWTKIKIYARGHDIPNVYSNEFGLTSGASAIVAGFAASLQGIAYASNKYIPPAIMLRLLQKVGYVVTGTGGGVIPNYDEAAAELGRLMTGAGLPNR